MNTDVAVSSSMGRVSAAPAGRCPCCGARTLAARGERRFGLLDVMIVVVASAVTFALVRPWWVGGTTGRQPGWELYLAALVCGLVAWTPAALVLRLRRPRPALRRLARQPGFAATLAGTSILALSLPAIGLIALVREAKRGPLAQLGTPAPPDPSWWLDVVLHFGLLAGPVVLGVWLLLAIGGRRRPMRGWPDILGRTLGGLWIVLFVISSCFRLSHLAN